jgi:hypothetical protein
MFTSLPLHSASAPLSSHLFSLNTMDIALGYTTIDGYLISQEEGETALRTGMAVVVGGLLVGLGASYN